MAVYYPNYLKEEKKLIEPLTDTEKRIVKLLCDKIGSKEICELCCISYSGLKFHNSNMYRKLGVNNRNDAELEAVIFLLMINMRQMWIRKTNIL